LTKSIKKFLIKKVGVWLAFQIL